MNSQTKPEIGRKKPQKPKKATFTKGCAVSSGGGGGTIEIMNKAVKMMMNEGLNEDEMKKTKNKSSKTNNDENDETIALRGWRGDEKEDDDFETDGLGIIPSSSSRRTTTPSLAKTINDAVSDVATLDADETVQERMAKQVRDMREKKKKKAKETTTTNGRDDRMKAEEDERNAADLSKASVHAVPRGLMSSSSNKSGDVSRGSSSVDAVELIKKHEKHAKKAFRQAEREREQAQKRLKKVREKKNRERRVFDRAVEKGFSEKWVQKAMEAHPEELSDDEQEEEDEEDEEDEKAKKMRQALRAQKIKVSQTKRFAHVLDFLCLSVPREEMPAAFAALLDAKSERQHSKIIPTPLHVNARNLNNVVDRSNEYNGEVMVDDPTVKLFQRAMAKRCENSGFGTAESMLALEKSGWIEEDAFLDLLRSLQPPHESTAVIKEELESVQDLRSEEKAALESIEGEENFKISNDRPHDVHVETWTIAIAIENDDEKNSEELVEESERIKIPNAELDVYFPENSRYPFEPAICECRHSYLPNEAKRAINSALASIATAKVIENRGEPVIYDLCSWLREHLFAILKAKCPGKFKRAKRGSRLIVASKSTNGNNGESEDVPFRLTGRGAHIQRTYARLENTEREEEEKEKERLQRIAYCAELMKKEKMKEEEDEERKLCVPAIAPTVPQTMDERLERWEREHEKRKILAKDAVRVDLSSASDLNAVSMLKKKKKKKIVPNAAKKAEEAAAAEEAALAAAAKERAKREEMLRKQKEREEEEEEEEQQQKATKPIIKKTSWLAKKIKQTQHDAREAASDDVMENEENEEDMDEIASAIVDKVSLAAKKDSAQEKAEREKRDREISNALHEKELAKRSSMKWKQMQKIRENLPARKARSEVISAVKRSRACVISGATGCGKTTQVPQFIYENATLDERNGANTSIIITQPRRISAIAVAERVADERDEQIGDTVGYSIRLESRQSAKTRMLFCTTGVLLRRLQQDPNLTGISHVVVDEVHERDALSDFLLVILRDVASRRDDFHLVAMSATVDADLFGNYFRQVVPGEIPSVAMQGKTFPVEEYRLEDAIEACGYVCEPNSEFSISGQQAKKKGASGGGNRRSKQMAALADAAGSFVDESIITDETRKYYCEYDESTMRQLQIVDENCVNLDLIEQLVTHIAEDYEEGAILVFLPGMGEIKALHDRLRASLYESEHRAPSSVRTEDDDDDDKKKNSPPRYLLVPLHSTLTAEEQKRAFSKPAPGVRKVVMSTNIAETSITIDDCVYVIDAGKVRETRFNAKTRTSSLETAWVSRASAKQRRGRAGRVKPGYCFHLYSSKTEAEVLEDFAIPEISRAPLDALVLQIYSLGFTDPRAFLSKCIEPPSKMAISSAMTALKEIDVIDDRENVTPLGVHLGGLPVDARLGKMLVYACAFGVLDPILTIAACVGFKSPFISPMDKRDEADAAKKKMSLPDGSSDHLTLVKAFAGWLEAKKKFGASGERKYCGTHFLSAVSLRQIADVRKQYCELLDEMGFLHQAARTDVTTTNRRRRTEAALREASCNASNETLVRAVVCGGLYPNVAISDDLHAAKSVQLPYQTVKVRTKRDASDDVYMHPSSVCAGYASSSKPYLLYHEIMKTGKTYIRDATAIGAFPLLLFGGKIKVEHEKFRASCDNWIKFRAAPRVAVLFKSLREELEDVLLRKIADPGLNVVRESEGLVDTIVEVLESEHATNTSNTTTAKDEDVDENAERKREY